MTSSVTSSAIMLRGAHRRAALRARLALRVTVTQGNRLIDAVGATVSPGLMRLVAERPATVGAEVSLVFLSNGTIVCARGVVGWCAATKRGLYTMSVRFTVLEDEPNRA